MFADVKLFHEVLLHLDSVRERENTIKDDKLGPFDITKIVTEPSELEGVEAGELGSVVLIRAIAAGTRLHSRTESVGPHRHIVLVVSRVSEHAEIVS